VLAGCRLDISLRRGPAVRARDHPVRLLVVWLSRASTSETAALLEEGAVEVLDSSTGSSEFQARRRNTWSRVMRAPGGGLQLGRLSIDVNQGTASWDGAALGLTRRDLPCCNALKGEVFPGC
jgi:DNA-binding response OmpR family regulator